jgi:hypothetical protein
MTTRKKLETEAEMLRLWLGEVEKIARPIRRRSKKYPKIVDAVDTLLSMILIAQARNVSDGKKAGEW